jgi:hypothetical protein
MTEAEIFHREMLSLGGRAKVPPENDAYRQIRQRFETLIASARTLIPGLPPIHLDFIFNGSVNACAFKSEGIYFLGITTGTIFMVRFLVMRMLSDARLFPFTGNPEEESSDLPPIIGYVPEAQQMYESGFRPERPNTEARLAYANHLFDLALFFLVGHEIAHITLGHVDYMCSSHRIGVITEMTWIDPQTERCLERQCFEMQADSRSAFSGISSLIETYKARSKETPPWARSPENEGQLIFDWAFAMNLLFRIFGDSRFNAPQILTTTYPPLPLRRAMVTSFAYGFVMRDWDPALKEPALHALQSALKYSEASFATILGENPSGLALADAFGPLGKEHFDRLVAFSFGLQQRLAPFCYEDMFDTNAGPPSGLP